jgi:cell shape-determining protein MreD
MSALFGRLIGLAFGAWLIRAAGPDCYGVGALGTNLLAAVVVQAGLLLSVPALCVWVFTVGLFWDFATFSPLGHHALVMGVAATLVRTQRGWWVGASWGEQAVGAILAGVGFFAWDRFLHCWEFREWAWPFSLSVALVLAGILNGIVSVPLGLWLNSRAEKVRVHVAGRRR